MLLPFQGLGRQADARETPQNGIEHDFRLEPDEWRANAKVDAEPKAEVTALIAGDVELIRVRKSPRVAIGRTYYAVHKIPLPDSFTADVCVFQSCSIRNLDRVIVTEHFFDGVGK